MEQEFANQNKKRWLPQMRVLRLMNFSRRPLRWQMTCYLFLFHPHLLDRTYRVQIELSAERWHLSFERPKQNEFLQLVKRVPQPLPFASRERMAGPAFSAPAMQPVTRPAQSVTASVADPEIEIIPLAPAWRQAA